MNRKMKLWLISMLMIGMLVVGSGTVALAGAIGDIQFVLPVEGYYLGGNSYLGDGPFKPYLGIAHEFSTGKTLYRYGGEYIHGPVTFDLNYGFWTHYSLPGYRFQEGLEGSITYSMDTGGEWIANAFSGTVSRSNGEVAGTSYLNMAYSRQIYGALEQEWEIRLRGLIGKENAGDGEFLIFNVSIPGKIKKFKFIPHLGFIQANGTMQPYFDLRNYLRGYDQGVRTGVKLAAMTMEQQFPLGKSREDGDPPAPSLLMGSVFLDAGDVLPAEQDWTALQFHYDVGVGLVTHFGDLELRLDLVFTDNGMQKLVLWMTI